jgi:hypothetical protein
VTLYARAWMWHMFTTMLFPDSTGDAASWMYVPTLSYWNEVGTYNWSLAALAYLYRHLSDACRRRAHNSGVEGCIYLLHVSLTTHIYYSVH